MMYLYNGYLFVLMFVDSYLEETMQYLLNALKGRERSSAFVAIGLLAVATDTGIKRHMSRVLEVVRQALPSKDMPQK